MCNTNESTCCRLGNEHLWGLLLLGWEQRRSTAQLGKVSARHSWTLQLLRLHLTDVGRVRSRCALGAQRGCCVSCGSCVTEKYKWSIWLPIPEHHNIFRESGKRELIPDREVLGVTEATGIWGTEALEKELKEVLPAPPPLVMGEAEEVTGELFSTKLGEFSQAFLADSICKSIQESGFNFFLLLLACLEYDSVWLNPKIFPW